MSAHKLPILPGNRLVLKHGLYAQWYPAFVLKSLACVPLQDLSSEILNTRAAQVRLTQLLFNEPDLEPKQIIALARAIAETTATIAHAAEVHQKMNHPPEPLSLAWDLSLVQTTFFNDEFKPK